jgi:hypothetical protein
VSRYKPAPAQLAALSALAAGKVTFTRSESAFGRYVDSRSGVTIGAPTIRRLRIEELIEHVTYGDPLRLTTLGRSVLAAYLPGAASR